MADKDPLKIIGQVVADKYRIERAVGEGGFAVVYRAEHTIWKKPVAIKFFSELSSVAVDQRDEMQQAFINEGALLTELSSQTAAIVQARDVGTYTTPEGRWMPFMVLEWLEGRSLEALLADEAAAGRPQFSLQEVMKLLSPVAGALDVAHGRGIAHRDVKPPNIFVLGDDPRGGAATVKILDFGVAKMITDNTQMKAALAKTGTNITSFTPQYGAPEQFSRSYGATGPWTDVFSLALVAIEMLTGRPALDGEDLVQLAFSAGNPEVRPTPRRLGIGVPDAVEAVFERALSVQPANRYARLEFWAALAAAASGEAGNPRAVPDRRHAASGPPAASSFGARTEPALSRIADATTTTPSTVEAREAPVPQSKLPFLVGGALALALVGGGAAYFMSKGAAQTPTLTPSAASSVAVVPAPSASASAAGNGAKCPDGMFKIPAGQFYMGTDDPKAKDNQKPAHNVTLDAFCLDAYEVTVDLYQKCTKGGACRRLKPAVEYKDMEPHDQKALLPLCNIDAPGREQHPMNCITWKDSETFCRKNGKRLPTEAEWEYATRGPDGRVYPWGDDSPTVAHLNACDADCAKWSKEAGIGVLVLFDKDSDGYAATAPVGKFPKGRSRFGPWDVVGNVWEWVADWEQTYSADEAKNPTGPASGEKKIIRGGAWNGAQEDWLHPSFRYAAEPERSHPAIGFRCASGI
ncbi:MAG: bifunctional serine/threonine-protein kinase/formylglycine-generating enzyme family protein [Polyangiaceae bacterium]